MRHTWIWLASALLCGVLAPLGSAHAAEVDPDWGSVSTKNGVLKNSCRNYRYHYEVTPPEVGEWDLSVHVVNPTGRVVWFGYFFENANPASGKAAFRLCRPQAQRGRYKLKAVVSNQHFSDVETRRLPTERFRLR